MWIRALLRPQQSAMSEPGKIDASRDRVCRVPCTLDGRKLQMSKHAPTSKKTMANYCLPQIRLRALKPESPASQDGAGWARLAMRGDD